MTTEQKAKAYDEALERMKSWVRGEHPECFTEAQKAAEFVFPELKENEDERVKSCISMILTDANETRFNDFHTTLADCLAWLKKQKPIQNINKEDEEVRQYIVRTMEQKDINVPMVQKALAWLEKQNSNVDNANKEYWRGYSEGKQAILDKYAELEKQGEQKPAENLIETWKDMRLEVYQQASGNRHEPNYSDDTTKMFSLNDIDEIIEKMSEQKPTDKVEPKFKVGDWVVYDGWTTRILKVTHDGYVNDKQGFISKERENSMRLWGIADAKDGDVLVTCFEEDNIIIMYHSRCTIDTINVHCCLDNKFVCENLGVFDAEDVKPATKEQRDTLFAKMKEAGYEWNAEKKELKKIEQKPAEWSEDDEEHYKACLQYFDEVKPDMVYYKDYQWLKSLKQRIGG